MTSFSKKLADGRTISTGQLFRIEGRKGWFTFLYGYEHNDDLTLYGPVGGSKRHHVSIHEHQLGQIKPEPKRRRNESDG